MSEEYIVDVDHVTIRFNLASEKVDNLKEYVIRLLKHQLMFQEFLAVKDVSLKIRPGEAWGLITQEGVLVNSSFGVSKGNMVLDSKVSFAGGEKVVAFLLHNGTVIAQTEPAVVKAIHDFTVTLDDGPVTEETTELTFTVKATDDSIKNINIAAFCRVDENGNVNASSYVGNKLFGQKPGTLHFTGISDLKAGEKLRLMLVYNNGDSSFYGEDITVLAPLAAESVTILKSA